MEHGLTIVQIVNPKGEMKGSAITGPVGKEAADLWPVSYTAPITTHTRNGKLMKDIAYCLQLWCRHVNLFTERKIKNWRIPFFVHHHLHFFYFFKATTIIMNWSTLISSRNFSPSNVIWSLGRDG